MTDNLPEQLHTEPDDPTWLGEMAMDIIVVRRYDTDDILVGHQYLMVMQDESENDTAIISSVARPPEPASI